MNYVAILTFRAKTPLKVACGDINALLDSPIQRDFNGLPMILGSSIAGALRSKFKDDEAFLYEIFGDDIDERLKSSSNDEKSQKELQENAKGSKLIISNALLLNENLKASETLLLESQKSDFLKHFSLLPVRDHNRISSSGVVESGAKFDEEIIFKGSMFRFRIELVDGLKDDFIKLILAFFRDDFRLGGGSTKGFGEIEIDLDSSSWDEFDIRSNEYQNTSSSLNQNLKNPLRILVGDIETKLNKNLTKYSLELEPDDFFIFGSGFGDEMVDQIPVSEKVVVCENGILKFSKNLTLIPASSVKGAISHRSVYHYNLLKKQFIGGKVTQNLDEIFGSKKDENDKASKGKILIGDIFIKTDEKIFEHVSIDRFSGGAIDGALFQEKTSYFADKNKAKFNLTILLDESLMVDRDEIKAFENALFDITQGRLPLGGATTKGHGFFSGKILKNGSEITKENL